jgi:hypothetical protein
MASSEPNELYGLQTENRHLREKPPGDDWDGGWIMKTK